MPGSVSAPRGPEPPSAVACLRTGTDSPVSKDSSTDRFVAENNVVFSEYRKFQTDTNILFAPPEK